MVSENGLNNAIDKKPPMLPQITHYGNTGTNIVVEAYDAVGSVWRIVSINSMAAAVLPCIIQ